MAGMIARIEGVLVGLDREAALVRVGGGSGNRAARRDAPSHAVDGLDGLGNPVGLEGAGESGGAGGPGGLIYEVLVPGYCVVRLGGSVGLPVVLHTLYYIEAQAQGSTMMPRLAGFESVQERRFFELFTTCKGIGYRKALRAMAMEVGVIAAAIADRDAATLQSLPEIGKRTAETIIATLNGKVDHFLEPVATQPVSHSNGQASGSATDAVSGDSPTIPNRGLAREGLQVLLQLGENRVQVVQWIDQVLTKPKDRPRDVQELVAEVYRLKAIG